eukprot:6470162-Amphidinium_carterae.1
MEWEVSQYCGLRLFPLSVKDLCSQGMRPEEASHKKDELLVGVLTALTDLKQARYKHCLAQAQIVMQTLVAAVVESGQTSASIQEALERVNDRRAELAEKQQEWENYVMRRTIEVSRELNDRKQDHCEALLAHNVPHEGQRVCFPWEFREVDESIELAVRCMLRNDIAVSQATSVVLVRSLSRAVRFLPEAWKACALA